jgi:signal transduction histidine kinase
VKYIALLLLAFLQVILSIVLGHKRQSKVSQIFIYFAGLLFAWTLANIVLDYSLNATVSFLRDYHTRLLVVNLANRVGFLTGALSLILLYRLVLVFPTEIGDGKLSRVTTWVGVIIAFSCLAPVTSGHYVATQHGAEPTYTGGSLSILILLYFLFVAVMAVRTVVRSLGRSVDPSVKRQAKTILAALLVTGGMAVTIIIVLPLFFKGNDSFIFIGYFSPYVFTMALFYSIFRQGFLDFRTLVARSVGYILSLCAIVLVLATLAFTLVRWLSGGSISVPQAILFALLNATTAVVFGPLKKLFDRITKPLFYQDAYDPEELFDMLNKVLVSTRDLDQLLGRASDLIAGSLKAEFCSFVLREKKMAVNLTVGTEKRTIAAEDIAHLRQLTPKLLSGALIADNLPREDKSLGGLLNKNGIALITRLGALTTKKEEGIGYIVLGAKLSGGTYNEQDARIIDSIANEMVIAIQSALQVVEIREFNATLQQRIERATKELRRTNEKLKSLDETKDDFISMASHQLRTPLTSVKGYLSMVLEGDAGKLNDNQRKLLEQSYRSSQQMVYLISDLLNLSRLNTGKFIIDNSVIDLRDIVQSEVNQLTETAKARGLALVYDKPASFPKLLLDETKIHQVIMNFIDNAIYYTPSGGTVTVGLRETATSVEYTVKDNGIGVPKSVQHKLFAKFYRAQNAQKARPDGTGLGLFMAKKVVVAQGGSIIFESEESKGSTFGFRFNKAGHVPPTD